MSKKTMKILTFVATIVLMFAILANTVFCAALTPSELTGTAPSETSDMKSLGNRIIGILQTAGIVLSVIILIVLGIKYMMGSAEEKAEYKKTMIPYLIGAAFIFLAPTIANVVYSFLSSSK